MELCGGQGCVCSKTSCPDRAQLGGSLDPWAAGDGMGTGEQTMGTVWQPREGVKGVWGTAWAAGTVWVTRDCGRPGTAWAMGTAWEAGDGVESREDVVGARGRCG